MSIDGLDEFNFSFDFSDEHAGIIVLLAENQLDKLLLDFYEDGGVTYLDIEAYGENWSKVDFL